MNGTTGPREYSFDSLLAMASDVHRKIPKKPHINFVIDCTVPQIQVRKVSKALPIVGRRSSHMRGHIHTIVAQKRSWGYTCFPVRLFYHRCTNMLLFEQFLTICRVVGVRGREEVACHSDVSGGGCCTVWRFGHDKNDDDWGWWW